ncbi:hypothetical protein HHI36_010480 [Cryptolaemus montrouzieri]|uniref:Uncharacterized protein n=1 Tax=Cryptolaemus montrouzieri TaxID=559131 RepID=A0ABD2MIT4_9CUCU
MDALITREDMVEALKKTNKIKKETKYRLSEIRPAANNTKTITLTIEEPVAEELLKSKNIRIGMVECEIPRQIYVKKCFKCWAHDHEVKECKGPDRSKMCRKCDMEDHQAKDCENEEYCPLCEKGGHKAGTGKCKHFKTALEKGRRIQAKYFPVDLGDEEDTTTKN